MEQHQKLNPAHSTGSPGFLRGRGRGRPKLIGDELDAELVDYMVQVKYAITTVIIGKRNFINYYSVVFFFCLFAFVILN